MGEDDTLSQRFGTRRTNAVVILSALCCSLLPGCRAFDPAHAKNITLFHMNMLNYTAGDIADMNTADANGDLFFEIKSRALPIECNGSDPHAFDCRDPEIDTNVPLGITKLVVEVDTSLVGQYAACNIADGHYSCSCCHHGSHANCTCNATVGVQSVQSFFSRMVPKQDDFEWNFWRYNLVQKLKGMWWSTLKQGQCTDAAHNEPPGCSWHVTEVIKRVNQSCADQSMNNKVESVGKACFEQCPQPHNTSSACWIECFYTTVLGPDGGSVLNSTGGMPAADLLAAWEAPFAPSGTAGSCPPV